MSGRTRASITAHRTSLAVATSPPTREPVSISKWSEMTQAGHEHGHRLAGVELQPQQPRVGEHDQQRMALAPRQAKLREVDLRLVAWWCFKAHDWIGRRC